jgi:hypothetical protein
MASEILSVQPAATPNRIALPMARAPTAGASSLPDVGVTYDVNRETGNVITQVVDRATEEIIREIPPKEAQQLKRALDALVGRLLDRRG